MCVVGGAIASLRVWQNRGCTFARIHISLLSILQNRTAIALGIAIALAFLTFRTNSIVADPTPVSKVITSIKFAIPPQFEDASIFSQGRAEVEINHKVGAIDKSGKLAIQPQFELGSQVLYFEGKLGVVSKGDSHGYTDRTGKFLIPAKFDRLGIYFSFEGLTVANINGKYSYVDAMVLL